MRMRLLRTKGGKLMSYLKRRLEKELKDSDFQKEWDESELEYVIAQNIIKYRKEKKLTQQDLAIVLQTSQSVISRIENADQNITIGYLKDVAKALDISPMTLVRQFPETKILKQQNK